MSIEATVPETLFSNVPGARAIAPDAWFRFPAVTRAQSAVFPEGIAARTDRVFPLPDADPNHAKLRPLRFSPAGDRSFPVRATSFAPPAPFASSARRFAGISVGLPEASRSI